MKVVPVACRDVAPLPTIIYGVEANIVFARSDGQLRGCLHFRRWALDIDAVLNSMTRKRDAVKVLAYER